MREDRNEQLKGIVAYSYPEYSSVTDSFRLDDKVTLLPVVHRSGAHARAVEQWLLNQEIDCLAVPLPPSFRESVMVGVEQLPTVSIVVQAPLNAFLWDKKEADWSDSPYGEDENGEDENSSTNGADSENRADSDSDEASDEVEAGPPHSYVPIDPSQSVIAAIRYAMGERIPVRFVDSETDIFEGDQSYAAPDCYALRDVSLEAFSAAILPSIARPKSEQEIERINTMAARLLQLRSRYSKIVMVCSVSQWPWIREAYQKQLLTTYEFDEDIDEEPAINYSIEESTLVFMLSELPYITAVYEQSRLDWSSHAQEAAVDGVKRLLLSARASYTADFGKRSRKISPLLLSQCLKYIRNLSLLEHRFTPDMYTLVLAAKQTCGDQFAIHVAETLRDYAFQEPVHWPSVKMGVRKIQLPEGDIVPAISRLGGDDNTEWRSLQLNRKPLKDQSRQWQMQWNPFRQCSWLPEDAKIESFRTRVIERAKAIMGADLARSEKFTTSMMDGLDMRETLRHWYDGQIYVKVQPPSVGTLDACVFIFDPQPDPNVYTWRTTWYAEYEWESTLAFYATDFHQEMLGPGIAVANYGGAMFLFPPRSIPDIWEDPELEFADTLEERLIAAACRHSESRQVALLSPIAPTAVWRRIAKRYGKSLVHVPLSSFGDAMIAQLRTVHVLNGQQVRSYAAHFIRQA